MPSNRGPVTSTVTIVFFIIASLFVAARLVTRIFLVHSVKAEDWWILAAWIVTLAFSTSICVGVHYGLGLHSQDIGSVSRHEALRKSEYAISVLYNPSLLLTKTSIIVFFLNVLSNDVDKVFRWCNYLVLILAGVSGIALTVLSIFQCTPISSALVYPTPPEAKCTDIVTLYLSSAPVNIITDLAILLLPMPILTGMRLQRKQKTILVATFAVGAFAAAVDVVRLVYLQDASVKRLASVDNGSDGNYSPAREEDDFSWYASFTFMWSAVEVNLGIICASVPILKPLFTRFMPVFIGDSHLASRPSNTQFPAISSDALPGSGVSSTPKGSAIVPNHEPERSTPHDGENKPESQIEPVQTSRPRHSVATRASRASTRGTVQTASNFDFFEEDRVRDMLQLSNRKSLWPNAVVVLIFFLWGTAYGLLDTLNSRFENVANISVRQGLGLHASYFSGYLLGPLTLGQYALRNYGFKASMMTGLCVYGCGALAFWPSAVLTSYPAFMISNFVVAYGLSCLEIAANPYIALCGPPEVAETRLCFGQGFQTIGTIVSPLIAEKVLFTGSGATALVQVQWTYLGIAFFVIGLAVVFYYIPLPETSDEQLQARADQRRTINLHRIGPYRIVWWTLALGVLSQWTYVGGQEVIRGTTQPLYDENNSARVHPAGLTAFDFDTVASTVYMAGRFASGVAALYVKPRKVLLVLYTCLIICCALQMSITGTSALVVNQLTRLFESGIFSLVFAISLRGMGKHTKWASAFITAAISGGAIFPVVQWAVESCCGRRVSYAVPLSVFVVGSSFPIYLNLLPAARRQVDPRVSGCKTQRPDHETSGDSMTGEAGGGTTGPKDDQEKEVPTLQPTFQHAERHLDPDLDEIRPDSPRLESSKAIPARPASSSQSFPAKPTMSSGKETMDSVARHANRGDEENEAEEIDYHAFLRAKRTW